MTGRMSAEEIGRELVRAAEEIRGKDGPAQMVAETLLRRRANGLPEPDDWPGIPAEVVRDAAAIVAAERQET